MLIGPSAYSLLVANLLPFAFFGTSSSKSGVFISSRKTNAGYILLSLAVMGAAVLMLVSLPSGAPTGERLLSILHIAPALVTLQAIRRFGEEKTLERLISRRSQPREESYAPKALNKEIEKIGWDDVIISQEVKDELQLVIRLLKDPSSAKEYGIDPPRGVLLEGPPGTGKTTIAKVVAKNAGLSFFALRMNEVVSKWVGDSEKNLSALFETAKRHAPAVIFMDEVESIGRARSDGGSAHADNLLNHLLQLMDGIVESKGLYIIAATNRADLIDPALLRPGRLHKSVTIPLPNTANRKRIFELYLSRAKRGQDLDIEYLALRTHGCSGADIEAICSQAGLNALKRETALPSNQRTSAISAEDILKALVERVPDSGDSARAPLAASPL